MSQRRLVIMGLPRHRLRATKGKARDPDAKQLDNLTCEKGHDYVLHDYVSPL